MCLQNVVPYCRKHSDGFVVTNLVFPAMEMSPHPHFDSSPTKSLAISNRQSVLNVSSKLHTLESGDVVHQKLTTVDTNNCINLTYAIDNNKYWDGGDMLAGDGWSEGLSVWPRLHTTTGNVV